MLKDRNAAATKLNVSGSLHVIGSGGLGPVDDHFVFFHGRENQWWVERNGITVYASSSSTDTVPVVRVNGQMVHHRRNSIPRIGDLFTPRDLLGPRSLLSRTTRAEPVPNTPRPSAHNERPGWTVDLASSGGMTATIAIDDRTGIITELHSPDHEHSLRLENLVEHRDFPSSRFVWDGPTMERDEVPDFGMSW